MDDLRRTPLHDLHASLGAKMVPFAGWDMPVQYPMGVLNEHLHTRAAAGLFDVSHMGQVILRGEGAAKALETLVPADIEGMAPGRQRYGLFTNEQGGIRDDLMIANKIDLGETPSAEGLERLDISAHSGKGLAELHQWLAMRLQRDLAGADFPAVTQARHRMRLAEALDAVEAAQGLLHRSPEMAGEDLRRAGDALARVTGTIGVEDILGEVFSTFCIGK